MLKAYEGLAASSTRMHQLYQQALAQFPLVAVYRAPKPYAADIKHAAGLEPLYDEDAIRAQRGTAGYLPAAPWDRDHRVERVYCSAIPVEHHAAIEERWGAPWFEAFGMTETGINIAVGPEDHDQLVLTACHPLYSAAQRWIVYARLTRVDPVGGRPYGVSKSGELHLVR